MTSKVRSRTQGHDVSHGAYDRCWPISRERHVLETQKLIERLHSAHPTGSSFKAKDGVRRPVSQTNAVTRPVTAETETVSYLVNGKTYEVRTSELVCQRSLRCQLSCPAKKL